MINEKMTVKKYIEIMWLPSTSVIKNIFIKIFVTEILLMSGIAYAVPEKPEGMSDGGCWAEPMNLLEITIGKTTITSNEPGGSGSVKFETEPFNYSAWCYTSEPRSGAHYFKSESNASPSKKIAGYFYLTDDIDFKITINLDGDDMFSVPFNEKYSEGARAGAGETGVSSISGAKLGNNGVIYFRLSRKILGGAFYFPGGIQLAKLYRYAQKGEPSNLPIYQLITKQTVVPLPVVCRINQGQLIKVPFGNIDNMQVTTDAASSLYTKQSTLSYKCNTALTQDIKVNLAAEPAGFSDAIKTSNPDIGVVMQYQNQTVKPNEGFKTKLVNGQGSDNVTFAVVGSGKTPATGPFTGSATLIISNL